MNGHGVKYGTKNFLTQGASTYTEPTAEHISGFMEAAKSGEYRGVPLHGVDSSAFHTWFVKFAIAVMSRLAERFPTGDMEVFEAFEIFNPAKFPVDSSLHAQYGADGLNELIEHYGTGPEPYVEPESLRLEWRLFKTTLKKYKQSGLGYVQMVTELFQSGTLTPGIKTLLSIKSVLPYNTAMCERGFSRMGLIKNCLRNRLYIETLDALMVIGLVGPDYILSNDPEAVQLADDFFATALDIWEADRSRNPKQARFGNKNAAKRRGHSVNTELPLRTNSAGD